MRTIIAGSRGINDPVTVSDAIVHSKFDITEVLSGTADGVDRQGELWAIENGVPLAQYPADWREHGRSAGFVRNKVMADNADALIAIWDGDSPGTKMMIDIAKKRKLSVFIAEVDTPKR